MILRIVYIRFKSIFKGSIDFNRFPLLIHIVLVLTSCNSDNQSIGHRTVFRYNTDNGITSLDPAFARTQDNMWAVGQLFNGLVQLDSNLNVIPCIAQNWEISDDGTLYTFHLRGDVFFHINKEVFSEFKNHRRKVVAKDVVYSFNRIMDSKTASPGAWIFNDKVGDSPFTALNDSTLSIRLTKPFPPFLGLLTMPYCYIVPEEAALKFGKDFGRHPVGTGPFRFKQWNEEVKLIFLKNEDYFEREGQEKLPYIDAVAISFLGDKQAAFLEFLQGNLDFFNGLESTFKDEIIEKDGSLKSKYKDQFTTLVTPFLNTEYLAFLVDPDLPASRDHSFSNVYLRQAIQLGINKKDIIKHLRNNIGHAADGGFIPAGLPGYSPEAGDEWAFDPSKAKELLKKVPPELLKRKLVLYTTKDYLDICLFVQKDLKNLGLDLAIEVQPASFLKDEKSNNRLNFFRGSWIADYPDAENYLACFYSKNFSPAGPNYFHFKNETFDKLYESIFLEKTDSGKLGLYRQMEKILLKESPVIPMFYDQSIRLIRHNVKNMKNNAFNSLDLRRVKL
ncbi:MAG: ABC transporter substrate-binding protein [Flavobacteriales bacterium]|nr:ABC transporter substrate-binding protein [Flavobacteriales bacterium]